MLYVAGELLNVLSRARLITPSPALDANYPVAGLYDGQCDLIAKFSSLTSAPSLTFDLAMVDKDGVDNGNVDTWNAGLPTGWAIDTDGTGSVTETTTAGEMRTGSAAKLKKSTGSYYGLKRFYRVRAGERLNISLWCRIAGSGSFKTWIYNPATRKFLTSGGAWSASLSYWATEAASTTYVEKTLAFVVESLATLQTPVTYLQLGVMDQGAGGGSDYSFVDDVFMWPTWNALVVSGHNLDPGSAPELRSSTDNFGGVNTLESSPTPYQPSFFSKITENTRRYARVALSGMQYSGSGAAWFGELAITYLETAVPKIAGDASGYSLRYFADNIVNRSPAGHVNATRTTAQRRRSLQIPMRTYSDAGWSELSDAIVGRCHGSLWPVVLVPVDAETVVMHGRLDDSWAAQRVHPSFYEADLIASDNPFPIVSAL